MSRSLALLVALSLAAPAAPPSVDAIPPVERPAEHFYGAIAGNKPVRVRWEGVPASVPLGGSFTLTLVVEDAANPHELTRPPLMELADFRERFTAADPLPDERPGEDVRFRYRMTPRNAGRFEVPELEYASYRPTAPAGHRTDTTYAAGVSFTVTPSAVAVVPPVPVAGDDSLFTLRGGAGAGGGPGWGWWAGLVAVGAGGCVGWVVGWRVLSPDGVRLARIRRHKAVRVALDRLTRAESAEEIGATVRAYLASRWGLAGGAQTPAEVAAGLIAAGVANEHAAEAERLLRDIDAARFGGGEGVPASRAAGLVRRWEGGERPV